MEDNLQQQAKRLPDLNDRETLIDIRDSALSFENVVGNESWREAYRRLASAADHLDAMIARTLVKAEE
jgi:hypothetical protein